MRRKTLRGLRAQAKRRHRIARRERPMSPSDEVRGRTNDPTCAGHVSVSARGGFDPPLDSTDALRSVVEDPVSDARPQDTNDDLCLRGRKALDRLPYSQFVTNLTGPSDLRLEPVKVMHDPLNHLRTTIFTGPPKSEPSQAIEGARPVVFAHVRTRRWRLGKQRFQLHVRVGLHQGCSRGGRA